jgi:hypothetical protein
VSQAARQLFRSTPRGTFALLFLNPPRSNDIRYPHLRAPYRAQLGYSCLSRHYCCDVRKLKVTRTSALPSRKRLRAGLGPYLFALFPSPPSGNAMPALLPTSGSFCGSPQQQQLDTLSPSVGSSSPSSPQPPGSKRGRKKTKPEKPAANEHLPPRTSCDSCRTRKLKCDGRPMADGGCERCSREKTACHYCECRIEHERGWGIIALVLT